MSQGNLLRRCSVKFYKIQRKTLAGVSFLIKLQAQVRNFVKNSITGVFMSISQNFTTQF